MKDKRSKLKERENSIIKLYWLNEEMGQGKTKPKKTECAQSNRPNNYPRKEEEEEEKQQEVKSEEHSTIKRWFVVVHLMYGICHKNGFCRIF